MPLQDPNAGAVPPQAGGAPPAAPPQEPGAAEPGQGNIQPAEAQGGEELLEPIQQMSDMIVQMAGPEQLAAILQQGLEQLMAGAEQGAQQPPVEAAPQPVPGGEGFGPQR